MHEKRLSSIFAAGLWILLAAARVVAVEYNPPSTYYSTATGTGATLKTQLQSIITTMTGVNYGNARYSAPYTDPDPNASGKILLIYNRASISGIWDGNNLPWNREHIWPLSRLGVSDPGNGTTGIATDQFNLRPANPTINSDRGSAPFGSDTATGSYGYRGAVWYPGDADAGDVARAQFYMATRYTQLSLTDGTPSGTQMGDLSALITFHFRDVPDDFELRRNHAIYGSAGVNSPAITNPYKQGNRNPYVDHPEYVWSVFVDQANDSQITLNGSTPVGDGGSVLNVDLGRRIVGAPLPAAQSVTLNKAGLDGSYYQVTTSGSATSSVTGRNNAFVNGTTGTRNLNVGLNASTATAGLKSGQVTVDNLDVTTLGGVGVGANDGNDVINVSLSVLNHANPSFSGVSDVNSLSYNFGSIAVGGPAPTFSFDIFNLPTTVGFTAGLDLDSIVGSGQTGAFTTNLATFDGVNTLAAGLSNSFTASLSALAVGDFSATYTLTLSDENLVGATALGQMTISISGEVVAASAENADFDSDGDVDGADFLTWQRSVGLNSRAALGDGDANGDAAVDADDLAIWTNQFGAAGAATTQAIPEPAPMALAAIAVSSFSLAFRRRMPKQTRMG